MCQVYCCLIKAPCSNRNINQRAKDIAMAVQIAVDSLEAAHKYLIELCDKAEAGKYND